MEPTVQERAGQDSNRRRTMLYQQKSFTLPASNPRVTEKNWDRATLNKSDFVSKYGETPEVSVKPFPVLSEVVQSGDGVVR
jgi:hypothetical protein